MTSYLLDTNIFLRAVVGDHVQQTKDCDDFFALLRVGKFLAYTSSVVLAEVVWTAISFYGIKKKDIVESVRGITSIPHLALDDRTDIERTLALYALRAIKFVDALIAAHPALRSGAMILVSYDRDFDRMGITRVEPGDVLKQFQS